MSATFEFDERNGAAPGTVTHGRAEMNWKNVDDSTTAYTSSPITAGNNSYDKFQYAHFSGSWNQILNAKYDHTAGVLGSGLTLYGAKSMSAVGDQVSYRTPVTSTGITNSVDITAVNGSFPTGAKTLYLSTSGVGDAAATASINNTTGSGYSCFMYTQLATTTAAAAGDTAQLTLTFQFDEN